MSIFIHSHDFTSGTSSDGTWQFGQSIKGNYKVDAQVMDTQDFPWLFAGQNTMVMRIHDPMNDLIYATFQIDFNPTIGLISDIATIATQMVNEIQGAIEAAAVDAPYAARTVSESHDPHSIVFHFDNDPVDILWQGDISPPYYSTINPSLGKSSTTPDELAIRDLTIDTSEMVTDPKFLEVYIEESSTEIINTHETHPTLLFSTRDSEFTGQTFEIRNETTELTIGVHKMGSVLPLPLTGQWYLMISPF